MILSKTFASMFLMMSLTASTLATTKTKEQMTVIEWNMMKYMSTNIEMMIMTDKKSMAFAACVMLITSAVITYSSYYMKESTKKTPFMKLIMIFIMSMMLMIFSPNMITLILGWEGLGMTSFILITFYQNKKSLNSSFYTMMMNRAGDIMLMMTMIKMMETSSWMITQITNSMENKMLVTTLIAAFSKSAQIPFSAWLTEAMAAPTPISALVHSSTLVTAGIFMLIRFEQTLKYSTATTTIFTISMMTLVMASMNSTTEWDIKKIVALSTLSQLSMMFITISMNLFNLAMFHLLVHATFKALIFLTSSSFISFANTQDIRKINNLSKNMFMTKLSFNLATLTLCGFPILSSFYSKEMIMEMMIIKKMNMMTTIMFYMCMAITLFYSMKTMTFINQMKYSQKMTPQKETWAQKSSKMMLLLPSTTYGNKMNWMINLNYKLPHLEKTMKIIPAITMILMMIMINEMMKSNTSSTKKKNSPARFINYMWFMKNMSIQIKKIALAKFLLTFKQTEKTMFKKSTETKKKMNKYISQQNFKITHKNTKLINLMMLFSVMMMM